MRGRWPAEHVHAGVPHVGRRRRSAGRTELAGCRRIKAIEYYEYCSYASSSDARTAEDRLLNVCDEEEACPFNRHRRSSLPDGKAGIVYVLHN